MSFTEELENRVLTWCKKHDLLSCENILVALSGGPDSVALLRILIDLKNNNPELKYGLSAYHVNHNLRGVNSDGDEEFVRCLCEELDIPLVVSSFDVKKQAAEEGSSLEETGRKIRYSAMREYCLSNLGDYRIAIAHHAGDIAETMLMNLFRGSGLEGLVSPKPANEDLIRPLLCANKDELIKYLAEINQGYRIDETNSHEDCTRNMWRNRIIPEISKISIKEPVSALNSSYELLADDVLFISGEVDKAYDRLVFSDEQGIVYVNNDELLILPPAIRNRVIRRMWKNVFGDTVDFEKVNIDYYLKLISGDKAEKYIDMPFERLAFSSSGLSGFCLEEQKNHVIRRIAKAKGVLCCSGKISLSLTELLNKTTKLPNSGLQIKAAVVENNEAIEYNNMSWFFPVYDEGITVDDVYLMNDIDKTYGFNRAGSSVNVNFGKLMSNYHIPQSARNEVLTAVCDKEILWIPGVGHSVGFVDKKSETHFYNEEKKPKYLIAISVEGENNG